MTDLERYLQVKIKGGYRTSMGKNGLEYIMNCPYCDPGKGIDKMYINFKTNTAFCHREHKWWPIQTILNIPSKILTDGTRAAPVKNKSKTLTTPGDYMPLTMLDENSHCIQWLNNRKPRDPTWSVADLSSKFNVQYCYNGKKFMPNKEYDTTDTIVFNFYKRGKLVCWQSRLLYNPKDLTNDDCARLGMEYDSNKNKYILPPKCYTAPGIDQSNKLYNFDNANKYDFVIITEGPFDAIASGEAAVAICGKSITMGQMNVFADNWRYYIILLDPTAPDSDFRKAYNQLNACNPALIVKMDGTTDPGSRNRLDIAYAICEAASKDSLFIKIIPDILKLYDKEIYNE